MDPRHERRVKIVQNLFAGIFDVEEGVSIPPNEDTVEDTKAITSHFKELDEIIQKHAPKYPLDAISKIDLCILRLAVYEMNVVKKEPVKVLINEAIELAKELGNDRSFAFINAVLGSIVEQESSDVKPTV